MHPDCSLPEGGRCARAAEFADPLAECPELARVDAGTVTPPSPVLLKPAMPAVIGAEVEDAAPWKGRHLDFQEAEAIVQRSPARLISVLGPYDAGKTSLMASFFLQIANGQYGLFPYRFASSRTLYGFQDLVDRANRWSGKQGEQVVDHTPKEESRDPGRFLHLGLRPSDPTDDRHLDVLLTDVAGEWIEDWTRRVDDGARRRLAFMPRSDGFLVVVDASALLGTSGAKMDAAVGRLIRRIVASAGNRRGRGLALVFSKFDRIIDQIEPPEEKACQQRGAWGRLGKLTPAIWSALEHGCNAGFLTAPFAVSAFPKSLKQGQPAGVLAPFSYVMRWADRRERWPRLCIPIRDGGSQFEAMRRWDAES
ncbi:hypothetical protein WME98_23735 [Sorangium sp. So ce296]|uniref:TRAFAC clade GTPase domain-containing protein n=1 Tax=Sorangium sp. So ce296 TaxID=3133296 RepID=UPI003F5E1F64